MSKKIPFNKEIKVGENDKAVFYRNCFCEDTDDGFRIIIGEEKINGRKEYILIYKDDPIKASPKIEDIWCYRDVVRLARDKK